MDMITVGLTMPTMSCQIWDDTNPLGQRRSPFESEGIGRGLQRVRTVESGRGDKSLKFAMAQLRGLDPVGLTAAPLSEPTRSAPSCGATRSSAPEEKRIIASRPSRVMTSA